MRNLTKICRQQVFEKYNKAAFAFREWRRKRLPVVWISFDRDLARQAGMEENATIYEFEKVEAEVRSGRQALEYLDWVKARPPVVRIPGYSGFIGDAGNHSTVIIKTSVLYKHVTRFLKYHGIKWSEAREETQTRSNG